MKKLLNLILAMSTIASMIVVPLVGCKEPAKTTVSTQEMTYQKKYQLLKTKLEKLNSQAENSKNKLDELNQIFVRVQAKIKAFEDEIRDLKNKNQTMHGSAAILKQEYEKLVELTKDQEIKIKQLDDQEIVSSDAKTQDDKMLKAIEFYMRDLNSEITKLKQVNTEQITKITALEADLEKNQAKIVILENDLVVWDNLWKDPVWKTLQSISGENPNTEKKVAHIISELQRLLKENSNLAEQKEDTDAKLIELINKFNDLLNKRI